MPKEHRSFLLCVSKYDRFDYKFCQSKKDLIKQARKCVKKYYELQFAAEIRVVEDLYSEVYRKTVDAVWED